MAGVIMLAQGRQGANAHRSQSQYTKKFSTVHDILRGAVYPPTSLLKHHPWSQCQ
jgi:hypothetical protein